MPTLETRPASIGRDEQNRDEQNLQSNERQTADSLAKMAQSVASKVFPDLNTARLEEMNIVLVLNEGAVLSDGAIMEKRNELLDNLSVAGLHGYKVLVERMKRKILLGQTSAASQILN